MPRLSIAASNLAWMASCLPAYRLFHKALREPQRVQEALLMEILDRNKQSKKGVTFKFAAISSVQEYQNRVPVSNYDDIAPVIDEMKLGIANLLTSEPLVAFEKSSGSSSSAKYIPYTNSLRREFQNAVRAWMWDLYRHDPKLLGGRSYWLITPLNRENEITHGGTPVGFENDSEYLGLLERRIVESLFAVPNGLAKINDIEASLYLTLRFLIQCEDLTLISVWNPSFLTILLKHLDSWAEKLLDDLGRGTASYSSGADIPSSLVQKLKAQPERARKLQQTLKDEGRLSTKALWPRLRLISCWTDGAAQQSIQDISAIFPGIHIQGKGLLATEGVATIPWIDANGCLPALTSHFFEFLPGNGGVTRLVHELEMGVEYSLVMTTSGGLYRYRLGDRVRVEGFYKDIPILKFSGRDDGVSDLRGEKLSPAFVQACLDTSLAVSEVSVCFAMLAPLHQSPAGYVLYVESSSNPRDLGLLMESELRANPHYEYCRSLGQLRELMVYWVRRNAHQTYLNRCVEMGQRAGGVKPTCLHHSGGWEDFFEGSFINTHSEVASW